MLAGIFQAAAENKYPVEIVVQLRHSGGRDASVAISPDGKTALSGSAGLRLWDLATGLEIREFAGHSDRSHLGGYFAGRQSGAVGEQGRNGQALGLGHRPRNPQIEVDGFGVTSVAFSPDGKTALSAGTVSQAKLWDLATGQEIRKFDPHSGRGEFVAFLPDGKTALLGSDDDTLWLWDPATGQEIHKFEGHTGRKNSIAISPDGKAALSVGANYTLSLWDLATGRDIQKFGLKEWAGPHSLLRIAISPDGKTALSGVNNTLQLWDLATGHEIRTFGVGGGLEMLAREFSSLAISPDGKTALSGGDDEGLRLWDLATGSEIRKLKGRSTGVSSVAFLPDGKTALSASARFSPEGKAAKPASNDATRGLQDLVTTMFQDDKAASPGSAPQKLILQNQMQGMVQGMTMRQNSATLTLWDLTAGRGLRKFDGSSLGFSSVAVSTNGKFALAANGRRSLTLWDLTTGHDIRNIEEDALIITSVAISPDGKFALTGSFDKAIRLWDLATGSEVRKFEGHGDIVTSVAFSPDGKTALSGSGDGAIGLWDLAANREIRKFKGDPYGVQALAFLPDGKTALSGGRDNALKLWDLTPGGLLEIFKSREIRKFEGHSGRVESVAVSRDGKTAISGSDDGTIRLWDLATGREIRKFQGGPLVAISPDGKTALSGSGNGAVSLLDLERGETLVSMYTTAGGEQIAITPQGFFNASQRDTGMLAIVRGLEVTNIGQVHQSLFNPDLVRQALAGDPDGEVKRAAEVINLEKVLDAGPAPHGCDYLARPWQPLRQRPHHRRRAHNGSRQRHRAHRMAHQWGHRGRHERARLPGPDYDVKQKLALDPGENRIEAVAYEGRNLLASLPAETAIVYDSPADTAKPKLHILAIGIDNYVDRGGRAPGSPETTYFAPLTQPAADARDFAAEAQKAGASLYSEVRVKTLIDEAATAAGLDAAVKEFAAGVEARDTFILYASAHGHSLNGRFYLIPQDYQGGANPRALATRAIGQERLQDWAANRIKAKKALILLDTCQSGALTGGYTHSRVDVPASEAAIGRLHEATGRPVLTAASEGKPAFEGRHGHSVFTAALIDALHNAGTDESGAIRISDLAAYVEENVPKLSAGLGGKGFAVSAVPGWKGSGQSAHFGTTGSDFALVRRLP